jgi:hypothetical protein
MAWFVASLLISPSSHQAGFRRELPHDLANEIEDAREKGEEVEEVSVGLDGDWFLRTDGRHGTFPPLWLFSNVYNIKEPTDTTAYKTEHEEPDMVSNVRNFLFLTKSAGLSLEQYAIQFFTFVPDQTGYVTVLHKTDGSFTHCMWHNVPQEVDEVLEREALHGVRRVTVGVNGSYVILLNTGVMWWSGVPDPLRRLLEDAERRGRPVVVSIANLICNGHRHPID